MEELGLHDVHYNEENGFVIGTLPSNVSEPVRSIGFIAHMDTADFNAVNVDPKLLKTMTVSQRSNWIKRANLH